MAGRKRLNWHFLDYPTHNDVVLCKTVDGDLIIASWDESKGVWEDAGRDWSWFGAGIACWTDDFEIPETTKQMPLPKYTSPVSVRPYPEKEE